MTLRVIRSAEQMSGVSLRWQREGTRIGVVPTMGALHQGHASLIRAAAAENDMVVVTIFVNPLQFGPKEDYKTYPRTLSQDLEFATAAGATHVFTPSAEELYPPGFGTCVEPGALATRWEGQSRPGHFRGVATVVAILFELTRPTTAYFGQKDYQQALIIQRMVRDLRLPVRVRVLPTIREKDGLAMSSRNMYLNAAQRQQALVLSRALREAHTRIQSGERRAPRLISQIRQIIRRAISARIEYVTIVDAKTLQPLARLQERIAILLAVRIGRTRLIDNLLVDVS